MKNTGNRKVLKKTMLGVLSVFIVALIGLVILATHNFAEAYVDYETTNTEITEYGKTYVSAHRSGGGIFPENTMMAFEGCINSDTFRTDIFEFDLHITKEANIYEAHRLHQLGRIFHGHCHAGSQAQQGS